jgi:hypothetical protein
MSFKRALRCLIISAAFGALCEFTAVTGAIITLAVGLIALMRLPRDRTPTESSMSEFGAWSICVIGFAITTIALAPFIFPLGVATALALCICSPLLGTMVYVVERYCGGRTDAANAA